MSEHRARINWRRETLDFTPNTYGRDHTWSFSDTVQVRASAAPDYRGNAEFVDPEQGYVAALSSCHMLTFLALASKRGFTVDTYDDEAIGHLEKNHEGRMAMTRVELRPSITFAQGAAPSSEELAGLHEKAHKYCFIANSVRTEVTVASGPDGGTP